VAGSISDFSDFVQRDLFNILSVLMRNFDGTEQKSMEN